MRRLLLQVVFAGLTVVACRRQPKTFEAHGLSRLTHLQWENSVVDLLHLSGPTGLAGGLVPDPKVSAFDNDRDGLMLNPVLATQYQAAAEELARRVVTDPVLYREVVPRQRRDAWLRDFGRRAYRRPLTQSELDAHIALFEQGKSLFDNGDGFHDGVQASLIAFLVSPHFLYRAEAATPGAPDRLDDSTFAQKLSYSLWNSMPDEALDEAAEQGLEGDQLTATLERMLQHPRGRTMVADLHRQLFRIDDYQQIFRPYAAIEQDFERSLPAAMQREAYAFVDAVVFGGGTVETLLTSRRSFVDPRLAELYGVDGVQGSTDVPVDLPAEERAGLLTLSGFLASHGNRTEPDLIRRGAFVNQVLLCRDLPPPPARPAVQAVLPGTRRERIEGTTSACGGACHAMINPPGFALGRYDQHGVYAPEEAGALIDASVTMTLDEREVEVDGAVELARALADSEEVHRCYARRLLGYLEQRAVTDQDEPRITALAQASMAGTPIRSLITQVVTAPTFRETRRSEPGAEP